jgi:hypothetical protein
VTTNNDKWLAVAIAALVVVAWLGRYDMKPIEAGAYVLDRWAGTAYLCTTKCFPLGSAPLIPEFRPQFRPR